MQAALEDLINSGLYEADDFTVVIQPFSVGLTPPLKPVRPTQSDLDGAM